MPRPRFDRLDPGKKAAILEAAAREFGTKGFDNASMNQILIDAGFSKGAAYYYFDDKADIFLAVLAGFMEDFSAKLSVSDLTRENFWTSLSGLYSSGQKLVREKPWILGLSKAIFGLSPGARQNELLAKVYSTSRNWVGEIMVKGQELGVIRKDLPLDLLLDLFFAIDQAHDRWFITQAESRGADVFDPGSLDFFESAQERLLDLLKRIAEPRGEG